MLAHEKRETGFAPVNGAHLYYEIQGTGYPLVLLHAGVGDSRMWDAQFDEFARYYRTLRCDLRGFGRSLRPAGAYAHYQDVAALLKHLDIHKTLVIGSSFGGYVALDLSLAYPDMVAALVLAAPALGGYEPTSAELLRFFAAEEQALARGDLVAATELNLKLWVDGPQRTPEQVNPAMRERVRAMQLDIFSQPASPDAVEHELIPPAMERLHHIQAPTLVIRGDQDVAEFQHIAARVAAGINAARLVALSGAAHLPNMEKPDEFNRVVLEFLGGIQAMDAATA